MNGFQILGLSVLVLFSAVTLAAAARHHVARVAAAGWLLLWTAAAIAIANPDLTMVVANWLGIDRGADLVFYCAILAMLAGFFAIFTRFRRMEHEMTRLVRELALREISSTDREDSAGSDR